VRTRYKKLGAREANGLHRMVCGGSGLKMLPHEEARAGRIAFSRDRPQRPKNNLSFLRIAQTDLGKQPLNNRPQRNFVAVVQNATSAFGTMGGSEKGENEPHFEFRGAKSPKVRASSLNLVTRGSAKAEENRTQRRGGRKKNKQERERNQTRETQCGETSSNLKTSSVGLDCRPPKFTHLQPGRKTPGKTSAINRSTRARALKALFKAPCRVCLEHGRATCRAAGFVFWPGRSRFG